MRVISVNVGLPQELEWRGQKIMSSILKTPLKGKVAVKRLNIDGDAQADLIAHGGEHRAIMVYQTESYQYWREQLHRNDLTYGQFGENLTVEGLSDTEVCIGDRYRIGEAVFEVTQPRVTCFKVAISLGIPEMPALLVAHRRPGFYFRVLKEGEICAGDFIEKIADGPEKMSVAEVDALLYSKDHTRDRLSKAVKIPAMSLGWQQSFQEILNAAASVTADGNADLEASASQPVAWQGYRKFVVHNSQLESENVRSFELLAVDGAPLVAFLPGQNIAVRIPESANNISFVRMYSLCGPPAVDTYRVAIKLETNGLGSRYMHECLQVNDILEISAPRGIFVLSEECRPVVPLSAGVGITPLLGMLHALVHSLTKREVWWVHSAKNGAYYPFSEEVKALGGQLDKFHQLIIYSNPSKNEQEGIHYDMKGHLGPEVLKKMNFMSASEFYICGPSGYLSNTVAALNSLGIHNDDIRSEYFESNNLEKQGKDVRSHLPSENKGTGPLVTFVKSKISFHWQSDFSNLLEAAEACDVPVLWSCRSGVCHRCESSMIDGEIKYLYPPLDPPGIGKVLICSAVPVTNVELDL